MKLVKIHKRKSLQLFTDKPVLDKIGSTNSLKSQYDI